MSKYIYQLIQVLIYNIPSLIRGQVEKARIRIWDWRNRLRWKKLY